MILLNGEKLAKQKLHNYQNLISKWVHSGYQRPTLAIIWIGEDIASHKFIKIKIKTCKNIGINVLTYQFPETTFENVIVEKIKEINQNDSIHGLIIQLPIPKTYSLKRILSSISKKKDIDGLNPYNYGLLNSEKFEPVFQPAIVSAIFLLFNEYGIDPKSKNITIVGDGLITGRALTNMLLNSRATVTTCNKFTSDISVFTKKADIVISCVGKINLIQEYMVNNDAIVIDIGTSIINDKVYGDVDFNFVSKKVRMITPVPGGVGPLTVVSLISNLLETYKNQEFNK
ncbi:bifunctional 5,10-methylenetetrahydrofolate dehydrogenase/5,10-methenyltetrahydrofolate cyclohydrolase [Mycoplasma sp. SG1]|uniref:bifunctional 5,10-methylenetetrahydrofolate dehydrogenase/5,10-methenyltetrahydrofolate cyclohydrolase n=1 Tax=Mycoplasma sp. SG1 TaxID=2810348 RepID=UPI0020255E39|nr:bifunctional 5,10-methylenetetrahydrofolate dehydrogenase/5,10-methenyltetrahydrofolate cyclohydrolase [Mycoplasma sp. SG1]URM52765.1 bifunctional 5,10-methylenetetrahydrofolate dehydrogenase/5,10-methenyltetrahydrofolate cyclohydrolase [Mycoplasma sp. SG1]